MHIYNSLGKFVFCFLENNQDMQLLHSFDMFTCGCPDQPIANTNLPRSLRASMYLLSFCGHYNLAANTGRSSCLEPLFLCYSKFLHQLPCCGVADMPGNEEGKAKDAAFCSPAVSLWELGPLGQTLLTIPSFAKGSPETPMGCMVTLYDATWVHACCHSYLLFSSALLSTV